MPSAANAESMEIHSGTALPAWWNSALTLAGPQLAALRTLLPETRLFTILVNYSLYAAQDAGVSREQMRERLLIVGDGYDRLVAEAEPAKAA